MIHWNISRLIRIEIIQSLKLMIFVLTYSHIVRGLADVYIMSNVHIRFMKSSIILPIKKHVTLKINGKLECI